MMTYVTFTPASGSVKRQLDRQPGRGFLVDTQLKSW